MTKWRRHYGAARKSLHKLEEGGQVTPTQQAIDMHRDSSLKDIAACQRRRSARHVYMQVDHKRQVAQLRYAHLAGTQVTNYNALDQ